MSQSQLAALRSLEHGTRFLLEKQDGDGLWRDFLTPAGEASQWPTGFIAAALYLAGVETSALRRAADALVVSQNVDGGWAYNEDVPSDADSTACALLFLALIGCQGTTRRRAAACLISHQQAKSGGIATYSEPGPIRRFMGLGHWVSLRGWCRPHCEVTATAGRALAVHTDGPSSQVDAAWGYVRSQQRADGSWGSYWWTSPHYTTLQAVELAVALRQHGPARRAAGWVVQGQDDDGGWSAPGSGSSAFTTALSLSTLVSAGAAQQPIERAVHRLAALQQDDGGWASHPIMRIPLPYDKNPDIRRPRSVIQLGDGLLVGDQHRTFTSAACIAALARARAAIA